MESRPANNQRSKLSASKSVGFRPGEDLRRELCAFADELASGRSGLTVSDILREGVTAYWTHIKAYLRVRAVHRSMPDRDIRHIVNVCIRAHRQGLTAPEVERAMEEALARGSIRAPLATRPERTAAGNQ